MKIENEQERYQVLIKEAEGTGKSHFGMVENCRRRHPRFKVEDMEKQVDVSVNVSLNNISLSGVSFFCKNLFQPGQNFDFKVGSIFSIQAEVIQCEMVETDAEMMEVQYLVLCKFIEQDMDLHSLLSIIDP